MTQKNKKFLIRELKKRFPEIAFDWYMAELNILLMREVAMWLNSPEVDINNSEIIDRAKRFQEWCFSQDDETHTAYIIGFFEKLIENQKIQSLVPHLISYKDFLDNRSYFCVWCGDDNYFDVLKLVRKHNHIKQLTNEEILRKIMFLAECQIDCGNLKLADKLLKPFVRVEYPEALFLYSQFSLDKNISHKEFDEHCLRLLNKAADLEYAPAIYTLATYYQIGEIVEKDKLKANKLFEKAADLKYSKARLEHALNLYYGDVGIEKNVGQANIYMIQAASELEDAKKYLSELDWS